MPIFHQITPFIEIGIIAIVLNYLLAFFWNTRSMDLILGLIAFLVIFAASSFLDFPILHKLMLLVANVAVIAILIIFQPELRVALSKLSLKRSRLKGFSEFDLFLDQLCTSIFKFSERRIGALIVLEYADSLRDIAKKGTQLDAKFGPKLLEAIFLPNSPLHDGAVIISDKTILAASVILPLAEETPFIQPKKSMGTRHLAALGIAQVSEAIAIVVSEETGKVSVARRKEITRDIKEDRLRGIIRSIYAPVETHKQHKPSTIKGWMHYILNWIKE